MTGPIELSRPERIAAIAEMRKHTRLAVAAVEDLIATINKVRVGDPLGTVRRDPRTGAVAIRAAFPCSLLDCENKPPQPSWHWIDKNGQQQHARTDDCISALEIVNTWPVIFEPEVSE